jgi:hypothetical protein
MSAVLAGIQSRQPVRMRLEIQALVDDSTDELIMGSTISKRIYSIFRTSVNRALFKVGTPVRFKEADTKIVEYDHELGKMGITFEMKTLTTSLIELMKGTAVDANNSNDREGGNNYGDDYDVDEALGGNDDDEPLISGTDTPNDRSELPIIGGVDPRSDNPSKLPVNILEPYNLVFVRIKSECLARLVAQKFEANREYAKHIFDLAVCGFETAPVNGEKIVFLDYCFSCDAVITVKSRLISTKYSITALTIISQFDEHMRNSIHYSADTIAIHNFSDKSEWRIQHYKQLARDVESMSGTQFSVHGFTFQIRTKNLIHANDGGFNGPFLQQKSFEKEFVYYAPVSRLYKDAVMAAANYLLSDASIAESRRRVSEKLKFRNGLLGIFGFTSRNILKIASSYPLSPPEALSPF